MISIKKLIAVLLMATLAAGCSRQADFPAASSSETSPHSAEGSNAFEPVSEASDSETPVSESERPTEEKTLAPQIHLYLNALVSNVANAK